MSKKRRISVFNEHFLLFFFTCSKKREAEFRRRSQAIQRNLPRPLDMNDSVLRPLNSNPPLTDLQRADELIKREMIIMLHHDCVETPTPQQLGEGKKSKSGEKVRSIYSLHF